MARRWRADASRVEQLRTAELKDLRAFDEEGAALLESRLERGEVHDRGIDLHLPEVRVDGRIEREVAGEAILEVHA